MELELNGKTALVVAASKGIGRSVAQLLSQEGCRVIISSSDASNLSVAAKDLGAFDSEVMDLKRIESIQTGIDNILNRHEGVDILVTNSPGPTSCGVVDYEAGELNDAVNANLISFMMLTKACVPYMKMKKFGRLIHLTSTTGREPNSGMVLSNVMRAGVLAFSKTLAQELGKYGITSNSILTGPVMTERVNDLFRKKSIETGKKIDELVEGLRQNIPVKYIAKPSEYARVVAFLASPLSGYINGVNLPYDGGLMRAI